MKPPQENSRRQTDVLSFRRRVVSAPVPVSRAADRVTLPPFEIALTRLPQVDGAAGLILLTVGAPDRQPSTPVGTLTDAALRGRLGHFGAHDANEIAAVRKALSAEGGEITIHESWAGLSACLQFWSGFVGLQVRRISWTCGHCGEPAHENIGGSVGETLPRLCKCGVVTRITLPKYAPDSASAPR